MQRQTYQPSWVPTPIRVLSFAHEVSKGCSPSDPLIPAMQLEVVFRPPFCKCDSEARSWEYCSLLNRMNYPIHTAHLICGINHVLGMTNTRKPHKYEQDTQLASYMLFHPTQHVMLFHCGHLLRWKSVAHLTRFFICTFSCAKLVMASAARLATPPIPPDCPSLARRFNRATSPWRALPSAMRFWCSGLIASRPTAKQASLSMSSLHLHRPKERTNQWRCFKKSSSTAVLGNKMVCEQGCWALKTGHVEVQG